MPIQLRKVSDQMMKMLLQDQVQMFGVGKGPGGEFKL